jgi:hypothetical protein
MQNAELNVFQDKLGVRNECPRAMELGCYQGLVVVIVFDSVLNGL